jgi:hypothetical protein
MGKHMGHSTPTRPKKKENDTHGHGSVWLFLTVNFNQLQEKVSYHFDARKLFFLQIKL